MTSRRNPNASKRPRSSAIAKRWYARPQGLPSTHTGGPSRSSHVTRRQYWFPTLEDVESVIYELASDMYPDYPDPMPAFAYIGYQGRALLESALAEPGQGFGGRYLHRTMPDKAAALLRSIKGTSSSVFSKMDAAKRVCSCAVVQHGNLTPHRVSGKCSSSAARIGKTICFTPRLDR